jgi:putative phosphoesterase
VRFRLVPVDDEFFTLFSASAHNVADGARRLPDAAWALVRGADAVLHAGDVVEPGLLAALAEVAPVHAVLGNNDLALAGRLPETLELTFEGVRVAMIHDTGPRTGREGRVRRRFPEADLVVFGHSHVPWNAAGADGQWLLNPGSPTERRGQPHRTMAVIDIADGRFRSEVLPVD